jgi:Sulfotransferase family/Core-2/I-Branching enzyme
MTNIALLFLTYDEIYHKKMLDWTNHYTTYINAKNPNKVLEYKHCHLYSFPTEWGSQLMVNATIKMLSYAYQNNHEFFMLLSHDAYPLVSRQKLNTFLKYQKKSCFDFMKQEGDEWKTSQWWILNRQDAGIILQYHEEYSKYKKCFKIRAGHDELYFLSLLKYYNPIYSFYNLKFMYVEWLNNPIQQHPTVFNCITDMDHVENSFFIRKTLPTFTMDTFIPKKNLTIKIIGTETPTISIIPSNTDIILITMIDTNDIYQIYKDHCIRIYSSLFSQLTATLNEVIELCSPYWEHVYINDEKGKLFKELPSFSHEKVSIYKTDPVFLKNKDYYLYSPHKIAFLFLTIGDINQPEIWTEYFKQHWHKVNIYVHPKHPSLVKTKWLKSNIIDTLVPTEWGFITHAYYELLKEALKNKDNMKFVFISESCIPLKTFDLFYKKLMTDHIHTSYVKFMEINAYNKNARIKSQPNYKELEPFVKHYARMCLSRYHSEKLMACKHFDFFNKMHVGDEFFLTCIHPVQNKDYIKDFEITYDNWNDIEEQTKQYNSEIELLYQQLEKEDISDSLKIKIKKELTNKQLIRDDIRKNPKTYTSITPNDIEMAIKKESFFWRKFTTKKLPWTYPILQFLPSSLSKNLEKLNFKPMVNTVFIHIPKTAGMSIYESVLDLDRSFGWFLGDPTKKGKDVELHKMKTSGGVMLGHISYQSALNEKILNEAFFKHSFKFCFVRNPYARLVSLYKYHRVKDRLNLSFDDFVELLYEEYKNKKIPPIGLYNIKSFDKKSKLYHHQIYGNQYNQMIDWIPCDIGYIGRVETFDEDMNHILRVLGYHGPMYISPKINTTKEDDYVQYYVNKKTEEYASIMYKDDIQRFGYKL